MRWKKLESGALECRFSAPVCGDEIYYAGILSREKDGSWKFQISNDNMSVCHKIYWYVASSENEAIYVATRHVREFYSELAEALVKSRERVLDFVEWVEEW